MIIGKFDIKLCLTNCQEKVNVLRHLKNGGQPMYGMKEIILEASSLPVEERAIVIDSLLRTLNPPDTEIEREWVKVAKRRLAELRSGRVKAIPGDEVFAKIRERFEK